MGTETPWEGEERFARALMGSTSDIILVLDAEGTIRYENAAVERVLGYRPGERIGGSAFERVHPDDVGRVKESYAAARERPGVHPPARFRLRHADGSWRHVESVRTNLLEDPAVRGMVHVLRDVTEREEAEAASREAEERYRTLVEQVPVAAYSHAPAPGASPGTMTRLPIDYMSPRVEDILGHPPEAFTRETGFWAALIHPDDKERVLAEDIRTDETGDSFEAEYRMGRAGGGWAWVRDASALVRDGEGRPLFWQGVLLDITERKRAEEALEESEERYRAVMEQSVEAIYLFDAETRGVLESNAAFQRMMGYSAQELLGTPIHDFIDHDNEDIDANVRRSLAEGRRHIGERRYRRRDGSVILVDTSASVISYRGERAICAISRDVTERRRVEEALKESEERFRSLIQNASDIITVVGTDGTVRYDSPAIERILGYEPGDRVGKSTFDYAHPDDRERAKGTFSETLSDPRARPPAEFRVRHKDGTWRHLEVVRSNLLDDPAVEGVVINSRDVTERKEAEAALRKSEERFRSVVQNSSEIVKIVAPDGTLEYASPAFERVLGYGPEATAGMNVLDHIHPDDLPRVLEETEKAIGEPGIGRNRVEYRFRHADGSWRHIEAMGTYLLDEPSVAGVVINARDVTERVRAERGLRESEERYRAVVEQSIESIYLFDPETRRVLESNAAFERLLGYSPDELKLMTLYDFVAHEKSDIDLNVRRNLAEGQRYVGERSYRRKDGSLIEVQVSATVIPYGDGEAVCVIARDITEQKRLEAELTRQAFHDSLTGLPNRALFLDRLKHALARAVRQGVSVAVLFVDLDDFKAINDSLGHEAGDQLLKRVGDRLASCVRPGDTVGRLFGDEFGVLLEAPVEVDEAKLVAGRVMESLRAPINLDGEEVYVNSSIGITSGPSAEDVEKEQPRELLRRADLAMYAAKSMGKGGHETFDPSMRTRALERMDLDNQLRRAVEREEFEVHYQPVVQTNTGKIEGFEALVRWRHPERGLVAAGEFIERAEETGLIRSIGAWVLEEACGQALRWNEQLSGRPVAMMVNFSASQFANQADLIPGVLGETGLEPGRLVLEITERTAMDDAEFALGKLRLLKNLGVDFAIDDYGTGYSSLRYLKLMPVDVLKIDRSFVSDLGKDPGAEAIVKGTIDLAHALGLKVVAEGVETAEQLERLKTLKCDLVQGYYLSFPLPEPQASALLAVGFVAPRG